MLKDILIKDVFQVERALDYTQSQMGVEISWSSNSTIIKKQVVSPSHEALIACVSKSFEEIVLIYSSLRDSDSSHGAAIFNPDGSTRVKLTFPKLISPEYLFHERVAGPEKATKDLRFINCFFKQELNQEKLLFWIRFKYDFFEVREVDRQTGEFGRCLGVSRQ